MPESGISSGTAGDSGGDEVAETLATINLCSRNDQGVRPQPPNTCQVEVDRVIYASYFEAQAACMKTANKCLAKLNLPAIDATQLGTDWTAVSVKMEQACTALERVSSRDKDASGLRGRMKVAFRSFCRVAGTGKVIASLVPNDLCGSVLSGGLNVIFTALEQTGFYREAVYKALERLPRVLENHAEYTELAGEDEEIHRRTAKLYTEVCLTMDHILCWFVMDAFVAGAKRLLNPSSFSTQLNDRMAEVNLAAKDLKARGTQVMWKQIREMSISQKWMAYENVKSARQLDGIEHDIRQLAQRSVFYENIEVAMQKKLQPLLQGFLKGLAITNVPQADTRSITYGSILQELDYDREFIVNDVKALLRLGTSSAAAEIDQSRVHAMEISPRVRAWLTVDSDSILLVNGRARPLDLSVTFAAAKMVSSLMQQPENGEEAMRIIPLAYFCSQHRNYYHDAAASPVELAGSLLLQLADGYPDFDPTELKVHLQRTDFEDIHSVCTTLGTLLERLPSSAVVFLVIDELSSFSTPPRRMEEMHVIVDILVDVYRQQSTPTLKMMFTSSTRSRLLENLFYEEEILDLPTTPQPLGFPPMLT